MAAEAILEDLVTPLSDCFSPEVAERIAGLRANPDLQARIQALGEKNNQGELTEEERRDYETIVRYTRFVSVLQSKARKQLKTAE